MWQRVRGYVVRDPEGQSYRRVERALEPPMFLLSLVFVPIIVGPVFADLSDQATRSLEIAGAVIWLAFVFEYLTLLYLAPDRWEMVKTHKLDLLVVALPVLRTLQVLRLARLAGLASGVGRAAIAMRRLGNRPGFRPFFIIVTLVVFLGAWFALVFEHEQPGASLSNYGEALWWSLVTCTTVGYGDHFPVTGGGQLVATVLMLVGIAGLSMLTASIAALFVDDDIDTNPDAGTDTDLRAQLDRIERRLEELAGTPS